jgi:hypothetical protein
MVAELLRMPADFFGVVEEPRIYPKRSFIYRPQQVSNGPVLNP